MAQDTDRGSDPGSGPARTDIQINFANVGSIGYSTDNVYNASTPASLLPRTGDKGVETSWNIDSLDAAITWLTAHADYLDRMSHGTQDIKNLIAGPAHPANNVAWADNGDGPVTSLGGFRWARLLAKQHNSLLEQTRQQLKQVVEELYAAADAVGQVRDKYQDAEHASAMSAADLEGIFTNAGKS